MRSYRIVLHYTTNDPNHSSAITPWDWDWHEVLDLGPHEVVSISNCKEIDTPGGHTEDLQNV